MNDTLTKCPNCGSGRKARAPLWYECETHESCHYSKLFSSLCRERSARQTEEAELAETRRKLEELRQSFRRLVGVYESEYDAPAIRPEWIESAMHIVDEDFIQAAQKGGAS